MKKIYLTLIVVFSAITISNAQCVVFGPNLIPNPSFENFGACHTTAPNVPAGTCRNPNELYQDMSQVTSWFGIEHSTSCTVGSTPDYGKNLAGTLPACASTLAASNAPCAGTHNVGYFVFTAGANSREYVQCQLTTTLTAGKTYCFSAAVRSRAGAAGNVLCNTNGFGAYFHNHGLINLDTQNGGLQFLGAGSVINGSAQVQASGNIPISCTTVSGTFVATGTETYLTMGNFRDDASTTKSHAVSSSYMYIDDVKLYEVVLPLPIELLFIDAKCDNRQVHLNWSTASEHNNDYFTIEKSCDGINFEQLAIVDGAGNSNQVQNYSFTDLHTCDGPGYYRLSQTDFDGTKEMFNIVAANCESSDEITIYPNPSSSIFTIEGDLKSKNKLQLYSANGELVRDFSDDLSISVSSLTLDVQEISSGFYLLCLEGENSDPIVFKLIIQR